MLTIIALVLAATQPVPFTETQKSAVSESVGKKLADPFSAKYEWQAVKSETVYCGMVNAKNQFGAYTGYKPFLVLYYINNKAKNLTVIKTEMAPEVIMKMCIESGYTISR